MCEFHLREKCFHPNRVNKGLIATSCDIHECNHCTDEHWRLKKIESELEYHNNIIALTLHSFESEEQTIIQSTEL